MLRSILKTKTVWTGIGSCIAGAIGYAAGEMTLGEAANMIVLGLATIFLRAGITKNTRLPDGSEW